MARNWLPWARKQRDKRMKKAAKDLEAKGKKKGKKGKKKKAAPKPAPKAGVTGDSTSNNLQTTISDLGATMVTDAPDGEAGEDEEEEMGNNDDLEAETGEGGMFGL